MMKTLVNITHETTLYDVFSEFMPYVKKVVDDNNSSHRVKITLSHASPFRPLLLFDIHFIYT